MYNGKYLDVSHFGDPYERILQWILRFFRYIPTSLKGFLRIARNFHTQHVIFLWYFFLTELEFFFSSTCSPSFSRKRLTLVWPGSLNWWLWLLEPSVWPLPFWLNISAASCRPLWLSLASLVVPCSVSSLSECSQLQLKRRSVDDPFYLYVLSDPSGFIPIVSYSSKILEVEFGSLWLKKEKKRKVVVWKQSI